MLGVDGVDASGEGRVSKVESPNEAPPTATAGAASVQRVEKSFRERLLRWQL